MRAYRGWPNCESWLVNYWLTGNEASASRWEAEAREAVMTYGDEAPRELAAWIEGEVRRGNPLAVEDTLYADLLSAAMAAVDWLAVGERLVAEVQEVSSER